MRTKFKQILSVALTALLALIMATPAFAANNTPHQIQVKSQDAADHTFSIYQVLKGDYSDGKLRDLEWGDGVSSAELVTELKGDNGIAAFKSLADNATASDFADALATLSSADAATMQKFASIVAKHVNADKSKQATKDNSYTVAVTGDGYYVMVDEDSVDATKGTKAAYTLGVVHSDLIGDNAITAKNTPVPPNEKKVKDYDPTTGKQSDWQDSADYSVGQDVPFQLSSTIPTIPSEWTNYTFGFEDNMSKGLTFKEDSLKVYANGDELTLGTDYTFSGVTTDQTTGVSSFNVMLKDPRAHQNEKITVEFTATFNKDAVIGQLGNPNKSRVIYTNDGKPGDDHTTTTPWDTVIVFTYKSTVTKTDGTNPLDGAKFTLYKYDAKSTTLANDEMKIPAGYDPVTEQSPEPDNHTFTFSGLDAGKYLLVETQTPDGYNSIDPISFTINADKSVSFTSDDSTFVDGQDASGAYVLKDVTAKYNEGAKKGQDFLKASTDTEKNLKGDVINKQGVELPSTGGMGTTILYGAGIVLAAGAGIALVSKRLAKGEE